LYASVSATNPGLRKWRLRFVALLVRIWLRNAFRRLIFPLAVTLNDFTALRRDFIFGMSFIPLVVD
jgi:hypothetical protein